MSEWFLKPKEQLWFKECVGDAVVGFGRLGFKKGGVIIYHIIKKYKREWLVR